MVECSVVHRLAIEKIVDRCRVVVDRSGEAGYSYGDVRFVLGQTMHIKPDLQVQFIKELEVVGLLQVKSKQTIKII